MRTPLAWRNVMHDWRRTVTAAAGVTFAILLVFMQLGFFTSAYTSATMVYDLMRFDAIVLSPSYVHLQNADAVPKTRLRQAAGVPGVAAVVPICVGAAGWRSEPHGIDRELLMLGVVPDNRPFDDESINRTVQRLVTPDTAVADQVARPVVGPRPVGSSGEINGRKVRIVGDYRRGAGLIADGTFVVSDLTFARLIGVPSLDQAQLGLVRLAKGARLERVVADLRRTLAGDARVWTRDELKHHEQNYFVNVKPVGLIFTSGLIIGLIVASVILYQVLSADIAKRKPQYATLKAMGYSPQYLNRVIVSQGLVFALLGYVPALLLAIGLYAAIRKLSDVPMDLTLFHATFVLVLTIATCTLSGVLAMRKIAGADPADLF